MARSFYGFVGISLLAPLAAGCDDSRRIIEPGVVEVVVSNDIATVDRQLGPKGVRNLRASFTINKSSSPEAIASKGNGGACLIADLNRFDIPRRAPPGATAAAGLTGPCTSNDQCRSALTAPQRAAQWSSYCLEESPTQVTGSAVVPARTSCWTRPGNPHNYCTVEPTRFRADGEVVAVPLGVADLYPPGSDGAGTRWRLIACLNGLSDGKANTACATGIGPSRSALGPILNLPARLEPPPKRFPPERPALPGP